VGGSRLRAPGFRGQDCCGVTAGSGGRSRVGPRPTYRRGRGAGGEFSGSPGDAAPPGRAGPRRRSRREWRGPVAAAAVLLRRWCGGQRQHRRRGVRGRRRRVTARARGAGCDIGHQAARHQGTPSITRSFQAIPPRPERAGGTSRDAAAGDAPLRATDGYGYQNWHRGSTTFRRGSPSPARNPRNWWYRRRHATAGRARRVPVS